MTDFFTQLQKAKKTCLVEKNLKKVHFDLGDGREFVEEYDLNTSLVTRRAWRYNRGYKGQSAWNIEIGELERKFALDEQRLIWEDIRQPFVTRSITQTHLLWRIGNLPYPVTVYSVTVDKNDCCLIVRTINKKYFKKLPVPDLDRLKIELQQENVSFSHKLNTLTVAYEKPKRLQDFEKAVFYEILQLQPRTYQEDVNSCNPS